MLPIIRSFTKQKHINKGDRSMIKKTWLLIGVISFMGLISTKSHAAPFKPVSRTLKGVVYVLEEAKGFIKDAKTFAKDAEQLLKKSIKDTALFINKLAVDTKVLLKDATFYVVTKLDKNLKIVEDAVIEIEKLAADIAKEIKAEAIWLLREKFLLLVEIKNEVIWKLKRVKTELVQIIKDVPEAVKAKVQNFIDKIDATIAFYDRLVNRVEIQLKGVGQDIDTLVNTIKIRGKFLTEVEKIDFKRLIEELRLLK